METRSIPPAAPAPSASARRGRPRSEEADRAILRAATELLAERGLHGLSIEEVASRAGVAKTTIYRRWHSRGTLALDAFLAEFKALQPLPDTGILRDDLLAALRAGGRVAPRQRAGRVGAVLAPGAHNGRDRGRPGRARVAEPLRAQHR